MRSDECIVFTPFAFSQAYTGYAPISELIRGTATDVTMVYGQPSWALTTLFRPFLWGYMLFGSAKGLSFFWVGRLIALFLVTFECARIFTSNNKIISTVVAVAISFSPIMQWWFATNGLAELFIFGQGIVLCLYYLFDRNDLVGKIVCSLLLVECMCGYLFVLYPAWQIPLFYLFAILSIYVIGHSTKKRRQSEGRSGRFEVLCLALAVGTAACLAGVCMMQSWSTIQTVMSTVYPGTRNEAGGGSAGGLLNYIPGLLSSIDAGFWTPNVCEAASMITLFPIGMILAFWALTRKRDGLLIALMALEICYLWYICIGVPEIVAKVTLLYEVQAGRATLALGACDILLLARSWSILSKTNSKRAMMPPSWIWMIVSVVMSCVMAYLATRNNPLHTSKLFYAMEVLSIGMLIYYLVQAVFIKDAHGAYCFLAGFVSIVMICGLTINPIQIGMPSISENRTIAAVKGVAADNPDALWLADNSIYGQAIIMSGASSICSTSVYPNLMLWHALDPAGKYETIYNRYEHISVAPTVDETTFALLGADSIEVELSIDDIEKTGATYWLSSKDLSAYCNDKVSFDELAEIDGKTRVYRIDYQSN